MPVRAEDDAPEWVEAYLLPRIESVVRSIMRQEISRFERATNARFKALDRKSDAAVERPD